MHHLRRLNVASNNTSPFHYGYKTVSQMFQFIVKNGICYSIFCNMTCCLTEKYLQMR